MHDNGFGELHMQPKAEIPAVSWRVEQDTTDTPRIRKRATPDSQLINSRAYL